MYDDDWVGLTLFDPPTILRSISSQVGDDNFVVILVVVVLSLVFGALISLLVVLRLLKVQCIWDHITQDNWTFFSVPYTVNIGDNKTIG